MVVMPSEHSQESTGAQAPLIILADDRESDSGVIEALQHMPGIQVQTQRLALGEYEVNGGCVFELKTMLDLAESLKDGRLFSQADRLVNSGGLVALILEGRGPRCAGKRCKAPLFRSSWCSGCRCSGHSGPRKLPDSWSMPPANFVAMPAMSGRTTVHDRGRSDGKTT